MLRYRRQLACSLCAALVALAAGADSLGISRSPGFGSFQLLLLAAGATILPLGVLSGPWLSSYGRVASVLFSTYVTLVAFELGLNAASGPTRRPGHSLRGLVQPSQWGGYELTPNWHGHNYDGETRSAVDINARGDRDDDPERQPPTARLRMLLLGDSQTFGIGLSGEETIESQIEELSGGQAAAYNLGVPGYGPGDSLEHYRERTDLGATHVFFLLYGNDLRFENCRTAFHTAFEGFIVPREGPGGARLSGEDLLRAVAEAERPSDPGWTSSIKSVALLAELRGRLDVFLDPERVLLAGRPADFSAECSRAAAHQANAMRVLASSRGQEFVVVVVPTAGEAALQRHSQPMQVCIDELRRLSVPMLVVRHLLSPRNYLERDEHLAASGAEQVAAAILAAARRRD